MSMCRKSSAKRLIQQIWDREDEEYLARSYRLVQEEGQPPVLWVWLEGTSCWTLSLFQPTYI